MLYAIIAILVIIADQWIKLYVTTPGNIPAEGLELIPGFLNLKYVENTGGPFGFLNGQNASMWFIIIAGVFALLVIIALATKFISGPVARWSIVLVAAGGVSNALDRLINLYTDGHVVDMFQFEFAKWFPVFNLADIIITIFCIFFIFAILFGKSGKHEEEPEDEFTADQEEDLEEEEEERPKRRGRKARKEEREEEEEPEEEPAKPVRTSRKARQARYDEEYEQYKAAQRARQEAEAAAAAVEPAPVVTIPDPTYSPSDPFAEWERANAARKPAPAFVPAQAAPEAVEEPVRPSKRVELKAEPQPAAPAQPEQPAVPETPVVRPARKPAPVVEESASFDLDDILAEFK